MRTVNTGRGLIIVADTIDELINYQRLEYSIAMGFVHHNSGEYRWSISISDPMLPTLGGEGHPKVGAFIKHVLQNSEHLGLMKRILTGTDLRGWLAIGRAWAVDCAEDDSSEHGPSLSTHPRRQSVTTALYLDHNTGRLTHRVTPHDTVDIEYGQRDEPQEGWNEDNAGNIVAALQMLRVASR